MAAAAAVGGRTQRPSPRPLVTHRAYPPAPRPPTSKSPCATRRRPRRRAQLRPQGAVRRRCALTRTSGASFLHATQSATTRPATLCAVKRCKSARRRVGARRARGWARSFRHARWSARSDRRLHLALAHALPVRRRNAVMGTSSSESRRARSSTMPPRSRLGASAFAAGAHRARSTGTARSQRRTAWSSNVPLGKKGFALSGRESLRNIS